MPPRDRPSHTAVKIARGIIGYQEMGDLAPLLPEGAAEASAALLEPLGLSRPWHRAVYRSRAFRWMVDWADRSAMPGQAEAAVIRKRFFDAETRGALEAGARQVLVLGAGFDTLAPRLAPRYPSADFLELDHPATSGPKQAAVAEARFSRPNLHLVAADLAREPLAEVLASLPFWDPKAPTVSLAEGLLMYLSEAEVRALLGALREATGPGSRLLFSWLRPGLDGRPWMGPKGWLMRASLRAIGEPLRWCIPPERLEGFLASEGYRLASSPGTDELRERFLVPAGLGHLPLGDAEGLAVAERLP